MISSICAVPNELTCTYFRDLRHVAAVGRLVKNHIDILQRGVDRRPIPHIALDELRLV